MFALMQFKLVTSIQDFYVVRSQENSNVREMFQKSCTLACPKIPSSSLGQSAVFQCAIQKADVCLFFSAKFKPNSICALRQYLA